MSNCKEHCNLKRSDGSLSWASLTSAGSRNKDIPQWLGKSCAGRTEFLFDSFSTAPLPGSCKSHDEEHALFSSRWRLVKPFSSATPRAIHWDIVLQRVPSGSHHALCC